MNANQPLGAGLEEPVNRNGALGEGSMAVSLIHQRLAAGAVPATRTVPAPGTVPAPT